MKQVFVFFFCILFSCTSNNKKQSTDITPVKKTEKTISITSVGAIQFTRSYSEIQSMTDQKKIDKYIGKVHKSNPGYVKSRSDSVFLFLFQNLELVKGYELLLSKFKHSDRRDTSIKILSGREIRFHFAKDTISGLKDQISVCYNGGSDSTGALPIFHQQIEYAFLDVIPGGNKELVVLVEDYLMNTEIYSFEVYEIKTKD